MTELEAGLGWAGALAPSDYGPLAARAEQLGFDALVVYGDLLFHPPALALAQMAAVTDRIRLVLGCLNPFTLHPVEIAGQLAYLDAASAGRTTLGLARGAWLDQLGLDQRRAISAIRDTVEIVRRLLRDDRSGYVGRVFSLAEGLGRNYDVVREELDLVIGTWSPKLASLAGEVASEVEIGGSANPAMLPVLRERLRPGAERVGRDARSVPIALNAVTVVDEDGDRARARARLDGAMYVEVVAALDPTVDVEPELLTRMRSLLGRGDAEAAGRLVPDDLLAKFVIAGTPVEVAEHVAGLADAGAARIDFGAPFGLTMQRGMELLSEEVLHRVPRI